MYWQYSRALLEKTAGRNPYEKSDYLYLPKIGQANAKMKIALMF